MRTTSVRLSERMGSMIIHIWIPGVMSLLLRVGYFLNQFLHFLLESELEPFRYRAKTRSSSDLEL
jgi:hypothetical protein